VVISATVVSTTIVRIVISGIIAVISRPVAADVWIAKAAIEAVPRTVESTTPAKAHAKAAIWIEAAVRTVTKA
jgi:hypothetical protein